MRIATSGACGMAALLISTAAAAQASEPGPGPAVDPNAPPPPPAPGLAPPPPPPAPAPVFADPGAQDAKAPRIAGWAGAFFVRDPHDYFRLYPQGRLHLDFHSFPGLETGSAAEGGGALQPRFFARRLRLEVSGQALSRWTFTFGVDFGGQTLTNADGATAVLAAHPDENTTAPGRRYAPVEGVSSTAILANAFINYSFCPCLNVMVGQQQAPFSMENRTSNNVTTFMERNLPIRGFVVPNAKEIGLTLWGDLFDERLSYELGVYAGDGQNRPQVDAQPDFIGRVFTRPLLGSKSPVEKLQVGVSGRTGQRNPQFVGYDYPVVASSQGWTFWEPTYMDSRGRRVHVLPSGSQNAIGGELRLPVSMFELRGEGYYVANDTREALAGFQLTNTERLGQMRGVGWYVQLSAWPFGDRFVNGDPGLWRPVTVDPNKDPGRPQKGLEVAALAGGIHASHEGASRGGVPDANTPGQGAAGSKIEVLQYAVALNYWFTRHIRASVNYSLYHTPGSGAADNLAAVPSSVVSGNQPREQLLHELGTRVGIGF